MRLPWRRDPLATAVTEAAENIGMEQAGSIASWLLRSTGNCGKMIVAGTSTQGDTVQVIIMIDMTTAQAICAGIPEGQEHDHG